MLEQANLSPIRKRDLMSAINRVCTMVGCPPVALRLEVTGLRAKLAAIRPAAHRIEPGTFANIRSLFVAALEMAGIIERCPRDAARHDPAWAPLVAAIAGDKSLAKGLATFMNWCAWTGVEPASVDDGVLQGFLHRLETRTLHLRPRDLVRRIPALWEKAQALVPEWPATELTRISFRPISPNLRWEELPETLRTDAEAYLAGRAEPDLFDDSQDAPTRPLAAIDHPPAGGAYSSRRIGSRAARDCGRRPKRPRQPRRGRRREDRAAPLSPASRQGSPTPSPSGSRHADPHCPLPRQSAGGTAQSVEEDCQAIAGDPLRPYPEEQGPPGGTRERSPAGPATLPAGDAGARREVGTWPRAAASSS